LKAAFNVTLAHLVEEILIGMGLMTKLATLFEVPKLFYAVIFVLIKKDFISRGNTDEFDVYLVIMTLLLVFLFYPPENYPVNQWIKTHLNA